MDIERIPTGFHQLNFLHRLPTEKAVLNKYPDRTIPHFFMKDALPTALFIRKTYTPNYQDEDGLGLIATWNWMQEEKNRIFKVNTAVDKVDPGEYMKLPLFAMANEQTSLFFSKDLVFRWSSSDRFVPFVAYTPNTKEWEADIRNLTLDGFEKLKTIPGEKKVKWMSTTRNLALVTELLATGGDMGIERLEAVDVLTYMLLQEYFLSLRRREKMILTERFIQ